METIEVRCPVGPQRLFAKLRQTGEEPRFTEDNLIEFACSDCRKTFARRGTPVKLVLHRYNFRGELVETAVER